MSDIRPFTTGDNSERVTSIPLLKTQISTVIYSHQLEGLQLGDWILALGDVQATNPYSYNAMFSTYLVLASSPNATVGTEVSEASSTNITQGMHHLQVCRPGLVPVTRTDRTFLNLVGGSASTQAGRGHRLKIDQDAGRLIGLIIRGALA